MKPAKIAEHLQRRLNTNVDGLPPHMLVLGAAAVGSLHSIGRREYIDSPTVRRLAIADLRAFVDGCESEMKPHP